MSGKIKLAVSWAAACGGCDVSLLDMEEELLGVTEIADVVYWPVAIDVKRDALLAFPAKSVDVGIFNGAVRTDEQEEDALVFREKCKVLVAYGACAAFGGIPGLGNFSDRQGIFDVAYGSTATTENPESVVPGERSTVNGRTLTLPAFHDTVRSLPQVVPVDLVLPGCPPPYERIKDMIAAVARYAETGELPPAGAVLASEKALCDECPRSGSREGGRIPKFVRPHEVLADPDRCFLDQGILCMGIGTRGGCGATCIAANMPCRGCFGPTPGQLDPAADVLSAIGSIAGESIENDAPVHEWKAAVRSIRDPAGTFYRYTLPSAFLPRTVDDQPRKEQP